MGRNEVILLGGQLRQSISRVYQINTSTRFTKSSYLSQMTASRRANRLQLY